MIISRQHHRKHLGLRFVTQNDHAHLASSILSLWRADGLPEHPRRQALLFAAREHDNGWREADAAPQVDVESGRPYDFITLPDRFRREIWRRGTERHAEQHPYPALLILEHARRLHRGRSDRPGWPDLLAAWDLERAALLDATASDPATVADDDHWIELSDLIALMAVGGWRRSFSRHGTTARYEPGRSSDDGANIATVFLDPFPLAGATTFGLTCRHLSRREYPSDSALALALATARWERFQVRLAPENLAIDRLR